MAHSNREILKNLENLLHDTNILHNTNSWESQNDKNQTCLRCYVGGTGTLAERKCTLRDAIRCSLNRLFRRSKRTMMDTTSVEAMLTHDAQIRLMWHYRESLHDPASQTLFEKLIFEKVVQLSLPMVDRNSRGKMILSEKTKRNIYDRVMSASPGILNLVRSKRPPPPPRLSTRLSTRQPTQRQTSSSQQFRQNLSYTVLQKNNNDKTPPTPTPTTPTTPPTPTPTTPRSTRRRRRRRGTPQPTPPERPQTILGQTMLFFQKLFTWS
jgi:hypothetical protein